MDVVIIFNGLGNQMSQYAFYLKKKKQNANAEWLEFCSDHNGFELNKVFGIYDKTTFKKRILYLIFRILLTERFPLLFLPIKTFFNFLDIKIVRENFTYHFKPELLKSSKGIHFYFGGWHTEKYFSEASLEIKRSFQFAKVDLVKTDYLQSVLSNINDTNSVALHVRRGDFLNHDNLNLFGRICNLQYYQLAVDEIVNHVENPHFFIFSNDLDWVKSNFSFENVTYVEGNLKEAAWIDMYLMSKCKNNIIANSSFSWWGAWLNNHPDKIVVSPDKFSSNDINSDVYPNSWIKIPITL